jgi:hypothetical protein
MHFFPQLYDHYVDVLEEISAVCPDTFIPFRDLPFFSYTLNVGAKSTCHAHKDFLNSVLGTCMVAPIGKFDYRKGGHLILHEWEQYWELPSGSIAFFPSAMVTHENVGIGSYEERRAITAFTSARFFQYSRYGFAEASSLPKNMKERIADEEWEKAKKRLSHLQSLL